VLSKLDVYFGVIGKGLHSCHLIFQAYMCEQVVYSIRELFSLHVLKCLQSDIVYRKARVVTGDIFVFAFYSLF
jgi:hypothetical protein